MKLEYYAGNMANIGFDLKKGKISKRRLSDADKSSRIFFSLRCIFKGNQRRIFFRAGRRSRLKCEPRLNIGIREYIANDVKINFASFIGFEFIGRIIF